MKQPPYHRDTSVFPSVHSRNRNVGDAPSPSAARAVSLMIGRARVDDQCAYQLGCPIGSSRISWLGTGGIGEDLIEQHVNSARSSQSSG
jgi:hypothetical protein